MLSASIWKAPTQEFHAPAWKSEQYFTSGQAIGSYGVKSPVKTLLAARRRPLAHSSTYLCGQNKIVKSLKISTAGQTVEIGLAGVEQTASHPFS